MSYQTYQAEEKLPLLCDYKEKKIKTKLIGIQKPSFYFSFYVFLYAMFLCSGAAIFSLFERPMEFEARVEVANAITNFKTLYPNVTDKAIETLLNEVIKATKKGVSITGNGTGEPNWSFGQSLFFTSTIVTTIGYGHVTPLSQSGKIFCLIYAMIGLPLTLVLLSALVERLMVPTLSLLRWLHSKLGHSCEPFQIRLVHLTIIVTVLVVFFLLLPAAMFYYLEPEWDYLDSIYYCFVSLTTIGLGDFIPGDDYKQPYRALYKTLTTVYLFLGITFMMLALAVFYDIPQLNLGLLFTSSGDDASEKNSLVSSGYVMFLCIGAVVFSAIEEPEELKRELKIQNLITAFLNDHQCVTNHNLRTFITEIVKVNKKGVTMTENSTRKEDWTFGNSLFFTSTIVTTIGYGTIMPLCRSGKVFCLVYAIIGLPLTLVLLAALVDRLMVPALWLLRYIYSKLGNVYEPFQIRLAHLVIIVSILVIFFILLPAAIFYYLESDWAYLDSIYYCFVSLTSIGLGDLIPGMDYKQPYRDIYRILTTVYLFMGLTFIMLTLAVFYDIPQLNLELLFTPSDGDTFEKYDFDSLGRGYDATSVRSQNHSQRYL